MKKLFLFLLLGISLSVSAQNRKIEFHKLTLQQALDQARATNKAIFVDCYTSWCVPCKQMDANVFILDSVADYFNQNLISLKIDMEKEQGSEIGSKYSIGAYPSYLLLDGNGKVLYKFVGGMPASEFMSKVRNGLKPDNEVALMNERYASGERNADFLRDYALQKIRLQEIAKAKTADSLFLSVVKPQDAIKKANWVLFGENRYAMYLSDIDSRNFNYLVSNWKAFAKENTKDTVDKKMSSIFKKIASNAMTGYYFKKKPYKKAYFEAYKKQILSTEIPNRDQFLAMMDMAMAAGEKNIAALTTLMVNNIPRFTEDNLRITWDYVSYCYATREFKYPREAKIADLVIAATKSPFLKQTCEDFKKTYNAADAK
jgi:thiol-disulfide isomerase/thioredoxin